MTVPCYQLYELSTVPVKPGLVRVTESGGPIEVDLYDIPSKMLGVFMSRVTEPLVIGDIELEDGRIVKGFLCQQYAVTGAKNITEKGSF